jgi:hypothetical protein
MRPDALDFPITREPGSRMLRAITIVTGLLTLAVAYLGLGGCESYCVLWPSIDTVYAPGFTNAAFERVKVGMSKEEVRNLIGRPLDTHPYSSRHPAYHERGDEVWNYTRDGACTWSDWAWLSREVIFRNGRVVQKVYWTYYD